jgi:hypothetical protein
MAPIIDPSTRLALHELGCLKEDALDTKAMARLLAERLEREHIARNLEDVVNAETTAGQLVSAVVGTDDEQLVGMVKPLLSGGATGAVQNALTNGHVLCAGKARIEVNIEGERQMTTISTRFLSAEPDVIKRYVLDPRERRATSFFESTNKLAELVRKRQPDMHEQVGTFIKNINVSYRKILGPGDAA